MQRRRIQPAPGDPVIGDVEAVLAAAEAKFAVEQKQMANIRPAASSSPDPGRGRSLVRLPNKT